MADVMPNKEVELKKLIVEREGRKLSLQQQELRLLEIDDEKVRIKENMEATKKDISNLDGVIKQFKENKNKVDNEVEEG